MPSSVSATVDQSPEHRDAVSSHQLPAPTRTHRLAAVTSHPVQYQAPLFRQLAAHSEIEFTAFYGHDGSIDGEFDRGFGVLVSWGEGLLDGYTSVFLQRRSARLNVLQRLMADLRIIELLWHGRFDAVFIHSYATRLSLLAYIGALVSRTPVLLRTESEILRPRSRWTHVFKRAALGVLFELTAGFLVIGKANRQFFNTYGASPARQCFTPYSVDNAFFSQQAEHLRPRRQSLRREHGWTDDVVVVGFSGKLVPGKGVPDLIDAVATLQSEGLLVGLLLIGDGPDRPLLEERVRARGVTMVVFTGFTKQSDLGASYSCLDIFVLPSRSETWGLVVNEAMLFSLPVLATNMVGAGLDLVETERNGYIFNVGDVAGLTGHLRHLVKSPNTRRQFGMHSQTLVQRYSYSECVKGVLSALHAVARGSSNQSPPPAPDRQDP